MDDLDLLKNCITDRRPWNLSFIEKARKHIAEGKMVFCTFEHKKLKGNDTDE